MNSHDLSLPSLARIAGKTPCVMQIIPHLGPGGAEQGCADMAGAIARAGGRSIVVSNGGSKRHMHELTRVGALHIDLPVHSKNPFTLLANIRRLQKLIVQYQVDIVHARSRAPAWSSYYACKRTGVPFMTTCHAPYNTQNKWKHRYNSVIAKGARVIAISGYVADYLRHTFGVGPDRLRLIHRGIAIERFHPSAVTPDRLIKVASEWRIPDGARVILLPGRLTRWKGQHILIDAMAKLSQTPDLFAVLLGSDQGRSDYTTELHKSIIDKGLSGRMRIVEHTDDMPAAYMLAHIVVSASTDPEGFGRIAIEGQAMGRMVIATNHGGSQETIIDNTTGFLIPPSDSQALCDTILHILSLNTESRAIIGTNAMMHVAKNFTRDQMMKKTIAVYNELITGGLQ